MRKIPWKPSKIPILLSIFAFAIVGCSLQFSQKAMVAAPALAPSVSSTFYTGSTYENSYRTASVVQQPSTYPVTSGGVTTVYLAYASDEYCGEHDCGVKNIVYRTSADNFASRVDVTTNTTVDSNTPQIYVKADGTVVIIYESKEYSSAFYNIALRSKATAATSFSARTDITTSLLHDAADPNLALTSTGVVELAYDSQEYCDANACNYRSVALRSSADSFASTTFIGTDMVCHAAHPLVAIQGGGSDVIHVMWNLLSNGSCSGGFIFRYANSSNAFASPILTTRATNYANTFAVKNDGTAYLFYSTFWPTVATGCPGQWSTLYTTSASGFTTEASVYGSCLNAAYSGFSFSAGAFVDSANVMHLAYISTERGGNFGTLAYTNSSDGFTARTYLEGSSFTAIQYPNMVLDSTGTKWVFAVTTGASSAGLNFYNSANSFARTPASKSTYGDFGISRDNDGGFWLAVLTQNYCASHGCHQLNIDSVSLKTGFAQTVTQFTSGNTQISTPRVLQYPVLFGSRQEVFYNSNEATTTFMNVARRSSGDHFQTPFYITNSMTAATTLSWRSDLNVDNHQTVFVPVNDGANGFLQGISSADWTMNRISGVVSGFFTAFDAQLATNPTTGEMAVTYGGNEGPGSWGTKIRSGTGWSNFFGTGGNYNGAAAFDPSSGDLFVAYTSPQALAGITNISIRKRSDNYVGRVDPFLVFDNSVIGSCIGYALVLKIDSSGVQHLLYTSREQNPNFCNIAYRNSLDWSKRRDVSTLSAMDAGPVNLYLKTAASPAVACYSTSFKVTCKELQP